MAKEVAVEKEGSRICGMKEPGKHSDQNWMKGFGLWFLLDKISGLNRFEELLDENRFNKLERETLLKVMKIQGYATVLEGTLVAVLYGQWEALSEAKKSVVRREVRNKIIKYRNLRKKVDPDGEAERLINEQTLSSKKIMITPVLQYVAGYTMGNLIKLAQDHFSVREEILTKMERFKEARNYVMHNSTSSREDVDFHFEEGLEVAKELSELLGAQLDVYIEKEQEEIRSKRRSLK